MVMMVGAGNEMRENIVRFWNENDNKNPIFGKEYEE